MDSKSKTFFCKRSLCDEEQNSQDKFKMLIEQRKRIKVEKTGNTPCQQRREILQFIKANQSFCGIISEAACEQQKCDLELSGALSSTSVQACVAVLKFQASQCSSPLDLLAAESLAKRLLSVKRHTKTSGISSELVTPSDKGVVCAILKIIKTLLSEHTFNRVHFAKCLTTKGHVLPLEVVWMLHSQCVVSINTYLACCLQDEQTVKKLTSSLENIRYYSDDLEKTRSKNILSEVLATLVLLAYPDKKSTTRVNIPVNNLEKVAQDILWLLTCNKFVAKGTSLQQGVSTHGILHILEVIRTVCRIPLPAVERFFASYLSKLLCCNTALSVYGAVTSQRKWSYASQSPEIRSSYQEILCVFKPVTVMEFVRNAVERDEVNWEKVLSFVSVFVVCTSEAAELLEVFVSELVSSAFAECDYRKLSVAFLVERQAASEGAHVFKPYVTWFENSFGENASLAVLSSKKSVQFLMKFLADMVPYEPAEWLKVHVIKAPSVAAKLRSHVTDYVALARTRLADLKEPVELTGKISDGTEPGLDSKTEQVKQEQQAARDVEKVLETFEKTGKVPSSVMEASIFRKPYFIGRFLSSLLTPRKLPEIPDARMRFIENLKKAGKIPNGLLVSYRNACEKLALEHDEACSSSDDGGLSNMEKLCKTLRQFTVEVLAELDEQKASKIQIALSNISTNIKLAMNQCSISCVGDFPVVLDLQTPELKENDLQVCDAVLNCCCKTFAAVSGVEIPQLHEGRRYKWTHSFVGMISSLPGLHATLYYRLWCLLVKQGASLQDHHIHGLASFICSIAAHHSQMKQVLLTGVENGYPLALRLSSDNQVAFAELLCQNFPNRSGNDMVFCLRFCSALIHHALCLSVSVTTKLSSNLKVPDSQCYVPHTAIKKLWYLFHRLRKVQHFHTMQMSANTVEYLEDAKNIIRTDVFKTLRMERDCQVSLAEWLSWEMKVRSCEDPLNENERQVYLWSTLYDQFIPDDVPRGGCDGGVVKACTVIFNALMDLDTDGQFQHCQHLENTGGGKEGVRWLFQELVLILEGIASQTTSETDDLPDPWLLDAFLTRLAKVENKGTDKRLDNSSWSLFLSREIEEFLCLIKILPPHFLFCNVVSEKVGAKNFEEVARFVNAYLKTYQNQLCFLPLNVTSLIYKGLLQLLGKTRLSNFKDELIEMVKKFLLDCPLFFISLQHHWKHFVPFASTLAESYVLKETVNLHSWIESLFEFHQTLPSFEQVCHFHSYVVGCCVFLAVLQRHTEDFAWESNNVLVARVITIFEQKSSASNPFATNVCLALCDCMVVKFAQRFVHGVEIENDKFLWEFISGMSVACPSILDVFRGISVVFAEQQSMSNLRQLVLDEKLMKLYPLVFFSVFMEASPLVIEKLLKTKRFVEVLLEMYLALAELRKIFLEEPLGLDDVSKELVQKLCPDLRTFLRGRRSEPYL